MNHSTLRSTRHHNVAVALMLLALAVAGCEAVAAPAATPQGTSLPTLDPSVVERGRQVYQTNCASCHGANAEGAPGWQKADASGNFPPPPHDDSGHTWHHPDRVLYEMIRDGMADPLRPGSPQRMPAFKDKLGDADMRAALTYFKSLWTTEHRAFQADLTQQDLELTPKAATPTP